MNRIDFENWLISKGANKKKAEAYADGIEKLCKILFSDQNPSALWLKLDDNINELLLVLLYSSRKFNFLD